MKDLGYFLGLWHLEQALQMSGVGRIEEGGHFWDGGKVVFREHYPDNHIQAGPMSSL